MSDLLEVRVGGLEAVADGIKLYTLQNVDGGTLPEATPGSHIDVHLPNDMIRQYSLAELDPASERYVIGVKLEGESRGGSQYLHEKVVVGSRLTISAPRNNFPLEPEAAHTVLIAGGIGITPIRSMARHLDRIGASWELHYACRRQSEAAFVNELRSSSFCNFHFDETAGGFVDLEAIVENARADAHIYFCGPAPMFDAFKRAVSSVSAERVHYELFAPVAEADRSGGFTIVLARSKIELAVPPGETILGALRNAGLDVSYSCEAGICGTCETPVIEGTPDHRDAILTEDERLAGRTMMICCSGSKSRRLVLDL